MKKIVICAMILLIINVFTACGTNSNKNIVTESTNNTQKVILPKSWFTQNEIKSFKQDENIIEFSETDEYMVLIYLSNYINEFVNFDSVYNYIMSKCSEDFISNNIKEFTVSDDYSEITVYIENNNYESLIAHTFGYIGNILQVYNDIANYTWVSTHVTIIHNDHKIFNSFSIYTITYETRPVSWSEFWTKRYKKEWTKTFNQNR